MPVSTPREKALKMIRRALCLFATIFFVLREEGNQYRIAGQRFAIGYDNVFAVCRQREHFVLGSQQSACGRRKRKETHGKEQGCHATKGQQPSPGCSDCSLP